MEDDRLLEGMRLVQRLAARYARRLHVDPEELAGEGCEVLVRVHRAWSASGAASFRHYLTVALGRAFWRLAAQEAERRARERRALASLKVLGGALWGSRPWAPDEWAAYRAAVKLLVPALMSLPAPEREILTARFGIAPLPQTVEKLAHHFGLSEGEILALERRAFTRLERALGA